MHFWKWRDKSLKKCRLLTLDSFVQRLITYNMKLWIFILLSQTRADLTMMESQFQELLSKWNAITRDVRSYKVSVISFWYYSLQGNKTDKKTVAVVTHRLDFMLSDLQFWGCWCHFEDQVGKGRGTPVNEIDELCLV